MEYPEDNPIRSAVLDRMNELGVSRYALAEQMYREGVCGRDAVYRWLRGSSDTTSYVVSHVFTALDMHPTSNKSRNFNHRSWIRELNRG